MLSQEFVENLFPKERTNEFFEALFGDAQDGAYDIGLSLQSVNDSQAVVNFDLHCRPGQCLRCNLTSGLPPVFTRHPIINAKGLAAQIATELAWDAHEWTLSETQQLSDDLHVISLIIIKG